MTPSAAAANETNHGTKKKQNDPNKTNKPPLNKHAHTAPAVAVAVANEQITEQKETKTAQTKQKSTAKQTRSVRFSYQVEERLFREGRTFEQQGKTHESFVRACVRQCS